MVRKYGSDQTQIKLSAKAYAYYSGSDIWIKEVEGEYITYMIGLDGDTWAKGLTAEDVNEYLEGLYNSCSDQDVVVNVGRLKSAKRCAANEYRKAYNRENIVYKRFNLNRKSSYDMDILERLEQIQKMGYSISEYIKYLVRRDIKK